jgi:hypothetical protein
MAYILFLIVYVATFVITELLRPKPTFEDAKPAGLGDFQVPTATEGRVVPIIWGRVKISGPNVVWYGDLIADPITEKIKTGLFSSTTTTTGFRYKIGLQMALTRGPVDLLVNIRNDESFAWGVDAPSADTPVVPTDAGAVYNIDEPGFFGGEESGGGGGLVGGGRIFPGSETQAVSGYLAAFQVPTPAYRGTCFITWEQGEIGLTPNIRPFEFEIQRIPDGLDLATFQPGDEEINLGTNPMNVIFEILNNSEWGLNIGAGNINVAALRVIAATLKTEGNGFAWVWDRSLDVLEVIRMIEEQVDGVLFIDPVSGFYDFKLIRFDYTPGTLPVLDETNVTVLSRFQRPAWATTTNIVTAEFTDRRKNYTQSFALAQDMANVEIVQAVNSGGLKFPGVKDPTLANALAWREIRQLSFPAATGQLTADRSQWDLVPGDVRELTWGRLGITLLPIRITKVNRGEILENKIKIDFAQDIFSANPGTFSDPIDTGWQPVPTVAQPSLRERLWEVPFQLSLDNERHLAVISSRNGGLHTSFDVYADRAGGAVFVFEGTENDFTPTALLTAALDRDLNGPPHFLVDINIDGVNDVLLDELNTNGSTTVDSANPVNIFLIDEELFFYESAIDGGGGTITLENCHRGTFDTVPADHANNAVVWFIGLGLGLMQRAGPLPASVTIPQVKILPRTVRNTLDIGSAAALGTTVGNRVAAPIPPGSPLLNIDLFVDENWTRQVGTLRFTWNTRNKFTQDFDTKQDDPDLTQPGTTGGHVTIRRVDTTAIVIDQVNIFSDEFVVTDFIPQASPGIPDELDFFAVISNRTTSGIESQASQTVDFEVFGFGLDFGGDFGGDANQANTGVVLAQGAPPFVPEPIPGSGLDREWSIDIVGIFNAADERRLLFTVFDSLAFEFVNFEIDLDGGIQTTLTEFAQKLEADLLTFLVDRPFTITRIGTQVRISTRFGDVSFRQDSIGLSPGGLQPSINLKQDAAASSAPIAQTVYIDFFENIDDPVSPGNTIDILSPTNDPAFLNAGFDQILFNIVPLTFETEQALGGPSDQVNIFATRAAILDTYSETFQEFYDALQVHPLSAFFTVSGPLALVTGLTFPMNRAAIVLTANDNFRIGPQFFETQATGGPAFPPFKLLVKEGTPPVRGDLAGLAQVILTGASGLAGSFNVTGLIWSVTLDGTVFAETVLTPGGSAEVVDAQNALLTAIDGTGNFDAVLNQESSFSFSYFIQRSVTNTAFEAFSDAGFGLRVEFRDISP